MSLFLIRHPEVFQGRNRRRNYFEGWYYKLADPTEQEVWAIIPGIAHGAAPADSHAFIQFINGRTCATSYHRFPMSEFRAAPDRLEVRLGDSLFTAGGIRLNVPGVARGELRFRGTTPWPIRLLAPGVMGWFAYVPFMECYHGVVSLNHSLDGQLTLEDRTVDFTGGLGYIEKDWGRSFPQAWIWLQSNHFDTPETSLMLSLARIPWLGRQFAGLICGLWTGGRLYVFATYTGAKLRSLRVSEEQVDVEIADRRLRLSIVARRSGAGVLQSPVHGVMEGRTVECISARVEVELRDREQLLFKGRGRNAGLEVMGDMNRLKTGAATVSPD